MKLLFIIGVICVFALLVYTGHMANEAGERIKKIQEKSMNKLTHVNPHLSKTVLKIIRDMYANHGVAVMVVSGLRTPSEQKALYAQGREGIAVVNALRHEANMFPISTFENNVVTHTLDSKHITGKAVDLAIFDPDTGKIDWKSKGLYQDLGKIAKAYGLRWGGDFGDYGHVEMI